MSQPDPLGDLPSPLIPAVVAVLAGVGSIAGGVWMVSNGSLGKFWVLVVLLAIISIGAVTQVVWRASERAKYRAATTPEQRATQLAAERELRSSSPRGSVDYGTRVDAPQGEDGKPPASL